MIKVGVVGYGYWGPNIVRNFSKIDNMEVVVVCDTNPHARARVRDEYRGVQVVSNFHDITSSPYIDAVAIITPVQTHYKIAKESLENGKHVFLEKPMTSTSKQAEILIELADNHDRIIMVDHTFLFGTAVQKIKGLIDDNILGNIYYFGSTRINLGPVKQDTNVIWDLATHDLSIIDYVINEKPVAISASGKSIFGNGLEDIGYITVYFSNKLVAHFHVNWLSPVKVRSTFVGGEKKNVMLE